MKKKARKFLEKIKEEKKSFQFEKNHDFGANIYSKLLEWIYKLFGEYFAKYYFQLLFLFYIFNFLYFILLEKILSKLFFYWFLID